MNSIFLLLALVGGDDGFQWAVDAPSFTWAVEGGDDLPVNDSQATGTDALDSYSGLRLSLREAIRRYRADGGQPAYVRGKTDAQHLVDDHGWSVEQISGLTVDELQYLHGASHAGKLDASAFRAPADASPDAAPTSAPGADTKPALTIRVAPFYCPPCNLLKTYDWSAFDVTWETGGSVERGYPEVSWTDSRGTKRWLAGAYRPDQVQWSMERTK